MPDSGAPAWRELIEKHHSAMVDEIAGRLDSEVHSAVNDALIAERHNQSRQVARAADDARRSHAETMNLALRRLRAAGSDEQVLQQLAEVCLPFARQAAVFVFEDNHARSVAVQGLAGGSSAGITFSIGDAPAVVAAIESHDPVIAVASSAEISSTLAKALAADSDGDGGKVYLFPVTARHTVVAMLAAGENSSPAPLEMLCGMAALRMESLAPPAAREASKPAKASWEELSSEEQKIHLQAQRMARVRVAEMRLYQEEALREGIRAGDIYLALRTPLDAARQAFLHSYLSKSPTMVDYLHLEIVRSLASGDDGLMGASYPGPMV